MITAVIIGAGQIGRVVNDLLNPNTTSTIAYGDNEPTRWNRDADVPVLPVKDALAANPDIVLLGVLDIERGKQMQDQLSELGCSKCVIPMGELYNTFDIRSAALKRISDRIRELGVKGSVAELGVYRGDFAWQINKLFPERRLYLFDTFTGFDERDVLKECETEPGIAVSADFSDTHLPDVLARMPYKQNVIVMKGHFPGTAETLTDERFALVSLDADLYAPTLAGLEYFFPRMSRGGVILLHDYNSGRFTGVKKAVFKYEEIHGFLPIVPLSDLHGTAVIIRD